MARLATLFGSRLEFVDASLNGFRHRQSTENVTAEDCVVGFGQGTAEAASLYAQLTGRSFAGVVTPKEVERIRPSVVVCFARDASEPLFRALSQLPRGSNTASLAGVIFGRDELELYRNVLRFSAAKYLSSNSSIGVSRADVLARIPFDEALISEERVVTGQSAASPEVSHALESGADLLFISSHGDGVDVQLSTEATLCRTPQARPSAGTRAPRCVLTGHCHRHHVAIDEAAKRGNLQPAAGIQARMLVADICSGVLDHSAPVSPEFRLIDALVSEACIGAIVSTWKIGISNTERSLALSDLFASSATPGEALAIWNTRSATERLGNSYCLIGDPDLRLTPTSTWSLPSQAQDSIVPVLSNSRDYITWCLEHEVQQLQDDDVRACLVEAIDAIKSNELSRIEKLLCQSVAALGNWTRIWIAHSRIHDLEETSSTCGSCGDLATSLRFDLGGYKRDVAICARCGIVLDAPAGKSAAKLQVDMDGLVSVSFDPDVVPKTAVVIFRNHASSAEPIRIPVTAKKNAYRVDASSVLAEMTGPTWASLICADDFEISVCSAPVQTLSWNEKSNLVGP